MGGGGEARKGVGLWEGRHCVRSRQRKACQPAGGSPVGRGGGEGEDAATVTLSITSIIDFQP